MMKVLRSACLSLAIAASAFLGIASAVLAPAMLCVAHGCKALACGVAKLKRELAYKFSEVGHTGVGAGAGLRRESNGYRQSSASEEDWLAPAAT